MSIHDSHSKGRHLRRFGLTMAIGFTLVGALSWWRGHTMAPAVFWAVAAVNGAAALVAPTALAPVERVWLVLGGYLAWINTRIILTLVFYGVVTPVGVLVRVFRDPLDRQLYESRTSYWLRRGTEPFDASRYYRQF